MLSLTKPDYYTLDASINKFTMNTFNKRETIGGHTQSILESLRIRFKNGEDKEQLILCLGAWVEIEVVFGRLESGGTPLLRVGVF